MGSSTNFFFSKLLRILTKQGYFSAVAADDVDADVVVVVADVVVVVAVSVAAAVAVSPSRQGRTYTRLKETLRGRYNYFSTARRRDDKRGFSWSKEVH